MLKCEGTGTSHLGNGTCTEPSVVVVLEGHRNDGRPDIGLGG